MLQLSQNPAIHSRAKHMDVKYHWQRQEIERGSIQFDFVPSDQNAADGLTKPLPNQPFLAFRNQIFMDKAEKAAQITEGIRLRTEDCYINSMKIPARVL